MSRNNLKPEKTLKKIIVVGAGGSGLMAAVSAQQTCPEVSVTVLEQNAVPGGVTSIATGLIRSCESAIQKKAQLMGISRQDAIKMYLEAGKHRQNPVMLDKYVERSGEAVDWLQSLGCKMEIFADFRLMIAPSREGLSGGSGMVETLYETAKKIGVKFHFETRAGELVTRDGKVVGVRALTKEGTTVQFEGDAVILADGGFWGASAGAFDSDIPDHLKEVIIAAEGCYPQGGSGDGTRMAAAVGSRLGDMTALEYTSQRYIDAKGNLCPIHGSDTVWSQGAAIILNQDLQRFLNEDLCYSKETLTDKIARELSRRHEKWFWNVWDEKSKENTYRIRFWIGKGFIDQGFIHVGNTLEELAQKMGVDAGKLKATVSTYNAYFEQGQDQDPQFGRNLRQDKVHAFTNPPFYAMRAGIQCSNRRGGICADTEAHALNKSGKPVPGLYVAGSSMNAVQFDGMGWLSGTGLTACIVWGRIAGINAAAGL